MALETYRKKRNFTATPEPKGRKGRQFRQQLCCPKARCTRLHYDFRLEMDGVLKAGRSRKGRAWSPAKSALPSMSKIIRWSTAAFEGTIPKGEYGGGTVILWDRGTWSPIGDAHRGYRKGHLDFELQGEKLGGRWHLVRMAASRAKNGKTGC